MRVRSKEHGKLRRGTRAAGAFLAVVLACALSSGCGGASAAAGAGSGSGGEAVQASAASSEDAAARSAGAAAGVSSGQGAEAPAKASTSGQGTEAPAGSGTADAAGAADTSLDASAGADTRTGAVEAPDAGQDAAPSGETAPAEAPEDGVQEAGDGQSAAGASSAEGALADPAADSAAAEETGEAAAQDRITFDGETDLEYNARQMLEADEGITREGALGIAAYLWQMGFGKMSGYPTISEVDGGKVLTVFDEEGLFYNIFLTPEGKIQEVEDVEGNELITLGARAGELVKPPVSGEDVIALLEAWKEHGGHSQVVAAYNQYAGDWGRSRMSSDDLWCSETVSAAYAALGVADKIGGMASNGNTYEKNARAIGAWVSGGGYIPSTGDVLITHDDSGDRHTACVISCDGSTIQTIAGGGSSIHHSSISVGSGRITGFVVPEW